jgi:hypothetical protein
MGLWSNARHSWGEHAWSQWAAGPLLTLSLVPQASLVLAGELPCLCDFSFSQLRHWEPVGQRLPPMHTRAGGAAAPFAWCSSSCNYCSAQAAATTASAITVAALGQRHAAGWVGLPAHAEIVSGTQLPVEVCPIARVSLSAPISFPKQRRGRNGL